MKFLLLLFFSINTLFNTHYSQEIALAGGDGDDVWEAMASLSNSGTITIKGDIEIDSLLRIPSGITLRFLTGNKFNVTKDTVTVTINGTIKSSLNQIFEIPEDHNLKIHNQEIYPEWFGEINYQDNTSISDDAIIIRKALKSIDEGGSIIFKGTSYKIDSDININTNNTISFINNTKLVIDSSTTNIVFKGIIESNLHQIFEIPEDHNLKIYNQEIYPEWFGKCEYQNNQDFLNDNVIQEDIFDGRIIQKAINASSYGGRITLSGKYYGINSTINVDIGKLRIKGVDVAYSPYEGPTNNIMVVNKNLAIVFNISANGVSFSNLNFTGYDGSNPDVYQSKGIYSKGTALHYSRNGLKDIDAEVKECTFLSFKNCIYGEGTNLKIIDNLFVSSYIGVNLNEAYNSESEVIPQLRGHVIDRNRFHSMGSYKNHVNLIGSTCIKIMGAKGFSFTSSTAIGENYTNYGYYNQITNNYADDCKTFFEGSVDRTKISNNSILTSGGTAIKAFSGYFGVITNNIIDGSFTWNSNKLFPLNDNLPSGYGIHVRYANHLTIHNNQILNKRYHGIFIERSHNSSIQSNTILNFNRHSFIKLPSEDISPKDSIEWSGIYLERTKIESKPFQSGYNIQNIISNNTINIQHYHLRAKYGIFIGDGDAWNLVKNNFINDYRLEESLVIENP